MLGTREDVVAFVRQLNALDEEDIAAFATVKLSPDDVRDLGFDAPGLAAWLEEKCPLATAPARRIARALCEKCVGVGPATGVAQVAAGVALEQDVSRDIRAGGFGR
jgi:hypothetical protein